MATVDWSTRPDQIEGLALREVTVRVPFVGCDIDMDANEEKYIPVLEPFCNGPKTEVVLINTIQVFCYEEPHVMKAPPNPQSGLPDLQCLTTIHNPPFQVFYNKDCISDQAIMYWHSRGSKPQGRQHFP